MNTIPDQNPMTARLGAVIQAVIRSWKWARVHHRPIRPSTPTARPSCTELRPNLSARTAPPSPIATTRDLAGADPRRVRPAARAVPALPRDLPRCAGHGADPEVMRVQEGM